jgi:hypothetical protein
MLAMYLEISNEGPKTLQMLGCVCLHIASKLSERMIISIESYRECCLCIFTRAEFEEKEAQVFTGVVATIPSVAVSCHKVSEFVEGWLLGGMGVS